MTVAATLLIILVAIGGGCLLFFIGLKIGLKIVGPWIWKQLNETNSSDP